MLPTAFGSLSDARPLRFYHTHSQHVHGKAIDVRLRGFDTRQLRDADLDILARNVLLQEYRASRFQPFWTNRQDIRELLALVERVLRGSAPPPRCAMR